MKKFIILLLTSILSLSTLNVCFAASYFTGMAVNKSPEINLSTIVSVSSDSPAEKAGLETGDLILRVNSIYTRDLKNTSSIAKTISSAINGYDTQVFLTIQDKGVVRVGRYSNPPFLEKQKIILLDEPSNIVKYFHKTSNVSNLQTPNIANSNYEYLKYYKIDPITFDIVFEPLTKQKEKELSKSEKNIYKKALKINNDIEHNYYISAFLRDVNYIPTYLFYYNYVLNLGSQYDNQNSLFFIYSRLIKLNKNANVIDENTINLIKLMLSYSNREYKLAKKYIGLLPANYADSNDFLQHIKANINYINGNYKEAIFYAQKTPQDSDFYASALGIIAASYDKLNNSYEKNRYIAKLVAEKPTYKSIIFATDLADKNSDKLAYYYKMRKILQESKNYSVDRYQKITYLNIKIAELEQEKIDNAIKGIKTFVKTPNWKSLGIKNTERQDEFFKATNNCINRYSGSNLAKCFDEIREREEKISERDFAEKTLERYKEVNDEFIRKQERIYDDHVREMNKLYYRYENSNR